MKFINISAFFFLLLLAFSASADHSSLDAAIGGGLGGAAGGSSVQSSVGGRELFWVAPLAPR